MQELIYHHVKSSANYLQFKDFIIHNICESNLAPCRTNDASFYDEYTKHNLTLLNINNG